MERWRRTSLKRAARGTPARTKLREDLKVPVLALSGYLASRLVQSARQSLGRVEMQRPGAGKHPGADQNRGRGQQEGGPAQAEPVDQKAGDEGTGGDGDWDGCRAEPDDAGQQTGG